MKPAAAGFLALALLTYFQFPGHTWLQQDTQIYLPVLEHQHDPALLRNDILAQHPNVAYTLYDEAALALHAASPLDFHQVLALQQIATRALGIWGLWLMAGALGLSTQGAWMVAMIVSLGATIAGPSVLTFEYEPTPRAFALPLVMCAIGLIAHRRYLAAGIAGACAFLYHPPTALPFWGLFVVVLALAPRQAWRALIPFGAACVLLLLAAHGQAPQNLFAHLTPLEEQLQRMRTAYVWISTWPRETIWHYPMVFVFLAAAAVRLRPLPPGMSVFALGLPVLGLLSMPLSWALLEQAKLAVVPQLQPLRMVLFIVLMAQFLAAVAGALAAQKRRWLESAAWFTLAYLLPLPLDWRPIAVSVALGALAVVAARRAPVLGLAAFFAIPMLAGMVNYPRLHTPELAQFAQWARASTPRDAVFLFPDAGHSVAPGIFRAEALRAVYVDWKGGGQVNYLKELGEQWWFRWQQTVGAGFEPRDLPKYEALGIQYVVVQPRNRLGRPAAFENGAYVVYALR
jgi:uncharacterized protein DUF6798